MRFLCVLVAVLASGVVGLPLKKRMVDMSYTYDKKTIKNPFFTPYEMIMVEKGNSRGVWLQFEDINTGTHVGTHMDSPAHAVEGGISIEDIPLNNFIAPASVIDIVQRSQTNPDAQVTTEDLIRYERSTGCSLDGTVVLLRSGWGRKWGDQQAFLGTTEEEPNRQHFPGLSPAAAEWLVAHRVIKGVGTEPISVDSGASMSFQTHVILLGKGLFVLENLANLDKIPDCGATLYIMPMKLGGASGAPTRVIATFPDQIHPNWSWESFKHWGIPQFFRSWPSWMY